MISIYKEFNPYIKVKKLSKKDIINDFLYKYNCFSPKQLLPKNGKGFLHILIQYENKVQEVLGFYKRNCFYIYLSLQKPFHFSNFKIVIFPIRKNQKYIKILYWSENTRT